MKVRAILRVCTMALAALTAFSGSQQLRAQQTQSPAEHAVSASQLHQDLRKSSETRQQNEAALREMFSSPAAQKTLKSAGIDYKQVDRAISQVSDEDLAHMAQRSQEAREDFAAGRLGDRDLLIILIVAVLLILVIVAVR